MTWIWPLKDAAPMFPDEPGQFGTARRHDIHTGIDLYCELGQEVVAVEDGEVISVENFTGPNADDPSPWWNDTQALLVKGSTGVVTYGEVRSLVKPGDKVQAGQVIAIVEAPVLKSFKGRPMVMLHLELMTPESTGTMWWRLDEPQSDKLLDPTPYLEAAVSEKVPVFDLAQYDGVSFVDTTAIRKPSSYWEVWGGTP